MARYYAPLDSWLYAAYAKGIELQPEDEVLDVACGSGVFLAKHAGHTRRIAGLDRSREMIDQARVENRERIDDDRCLMLGVFGVEVRRRVIVVVHRDDDPEEAANFRHTPSLRGRDVRFDAAISRLRVDMIFGITYDEDIDRVEKILMDVVKADDRVLEEPEPVVKVGSFSDSSVDLLVRPWVKTSDYWDVLWDMNKAIKKAVLRKPISSSCCCCSPVNS